MKGPYAGHTKQRSSGRVSILAPYLLLPCKPPTHAFACLLAHELITIWFLLKITFILHIYLQKILGRHLPLSVDQWVIFVYVTTVDQEGAGK